MGIFGAAHEKANRDSLAVHLSINRARASSMWTRFQRPNGMRSQSLASRLSGYDSLGTARPASRSEIDARFFWTISARTRRFSSRGQRGVAYSVRCYAVDPTLAARRGGPLRAVELASRGMRLIIDFAMGRASGSAQTMHAMTLQASSQSKAGCTGTGGIPIFTSIARLAGFISLQPFAKPFPQSGAGRRLLPSKLTRSAISLRE